MAMFYAGTATVAVSNGTATVTLVSDGTAGGFASLAAGSQFQCNGGSGIVDSNTGTVITITGWGGAASATAVAWKGVPPTDTQSVAVTAGAILSNLNGLNNLPNGRIMQTAAIDTLKALDCVCGMAFVSMAVTTPPVAPAIGAAYLIPTGATGDWAANVGRIAYFQSATWKYISAVKGMMAYNSADGLTYLYTGTAWEAQPSAKVGQTFGNAYVGPWAVDASACALAREGFNTPTGYAVLQNSAGEVYINSAANALHFRVSTTEAVSVYPNMTIFNTGMSVTGPVGIGTTNIVSTLTVSSRIGTIDASNGSAEMECSAGIAYVQGFNRISSNWLPIILRGTSITLQTFGGSVTTQATFVPGTANTYNCGTSAQPWAGGATQTAFAVTSGSAVKENARAMTQDEEAAALDILRLCPCLFQYASAVDKKGASDARMHTGFIADTNTKFPDLATVEGVMRAHGLDPARYGFWCEDPAQKAEVRTRTVPSNEGPKEEEYTVMVPDLDANGVQRTAYSLRCEELVHFCLAALYKSHMSLIGRIEALEKKLEGTVSTS